MRLTALAGCIALLMACAPADQQDEPEPAVSVADFAGTWNTTATLAGTEDPVETQMVVRGDGTGSMVLSEELTVPLQLSIMGDSLIAVSPEYESLLRPGAMVAIRTAGVLRDDRLMGNLTATYRTAEGDEVVRGAFESTRTP
jgi:hypothetical protein